MLIDDRDCGLHDLYTPAVVKDETSTNDVFRRNKALFVARFVDDRR